MFLFSAGQDGYDNPALFLSSVRNLRDLLLPFSEHLQFFSILIEECKCASVNDVLLLLKRLLLSVDGDNCIWVGKEAKMLFGSLAEYEDRGAIVLLKSFKREESHRYLEIDQFIRRTKLETDLEIKLSSFLSQTALPGVFTVTSERLNFPRLTVEKVLRRIYDKSEGIVPLFWYDRDQFFEIPFLKALNSETIRSIGQYLSTEESETWKYAVSACTFTPDRPSISDSVYKDVLNLFRLYIIALSRKMKHRNLPVTFLSGDLNLIPERSLSIISTILSDENLKGKILLVSIADSVCQPDCFGRLPTSSFSIPALSLDETREIISHSTAEGIQKTVSAEDLFLSTQGKVLKLFYGVSAGALKGAYDRPVSTLRDDGTGAVRLYLEQIDRSLKETLYIVSLSRGVLSTEQVLEYLASSDIPPVAAPIRQLHAIGLLQDILWFEPSLPNIFPELRDLLGERSAVLDEQLAVYIYSLWKAGKLPEGRQLIDFIIDYNSDTKAAGIFSSWVMHTLDRREWNMFTRIEELRAGRYQKILPAKPEILLRCCMQAVCVQPSRTVTSRVQENLSKSERLSKEIRTQACSIWKNPGITPRKEISGRHWRFQRKR